MQCTSAQAGECAEMKCWSPQIGVEFIQPESSASLLHVLWPSVQQFASWKSMCFLAPSYTAMIGRDLKLSLQNTHLIHAFSAVVQQGKSPGQQFWKMVCYYYRKNKHSIKWTYTIVEYIAIHSATVTSMCQWASNKFKMSSNTNTVVELIQLESHVGS